MSRRVVVTGVGCCNCLGNSAADFWKNLINMETKIDKICHFDPEGYSTYKAGQVSNIECGDFLTKKEEKQIDRFALLGLISANEAILDSGIDFEKEDACRIGVILGSGIGGMLYYEEQIKKYYENASKNKMVHPNAVQKITPNALSGRVAIKFNCKGPNLTISTSCSSSNHAIGIATNNILENKSDVIITGGAEAPLFPVNFASFDNMRVMSSKNVCRPFDINRDGFVMGEGAALLILEELSHAKKRGARIYAEIKGYGNSCGANHMVKSSSDGEDEARAIRAALKDARLVPERIDYVNAHGTGTILNDMSEAKAIRKVFGDKSEFYTSSIKGATGHLIGASAATEAVATILAIYHSVIPPNINFKDLDPQCNLKIPKEAINKKVRTAISNSFGFGSNNAVIVISSL